MNSHLPIAEFAALVGVSKQAIYKQINNPNSPLSNYILKKGKRTLIAAAAIEEVYKVETTISTELNPNSQLLNPKTTEKQPVSTEESQPVSTKSTELNQDSQPISTDYIAYLKAEIAEIKAEKAAAEQRLNSIIDAKDTIIKNQTEQLALLTQQVAQIAEKALITTSQQQYLSAMDKNESTQAIAPTEPEAEKKSFWKRLFG